MGQDRTYEDLLPIEVDGGIHFALWGNPHCPFDRWHRACAGAKIRTRAVRRPQATLKAAPTLIAGTFVRRGALNRAPLSQAGRRERP
jgi:hypothetical protein